MDKERNAPRFIRTRIVLALAALCAVIVGGVVAARQSNGSPGALPVPTTSSVPVTVPYGARPGPAGTKILTEAVDPLTLSVPGDWMTPAADALTLPTELDKFIVQAPALAPILHAERLVEDKSAIRLFAYQPVAPHALVSVLSLASPGAAVLTPSAVDAVVALAQKSTPNLTVSGVQLPVGQVLKLDSKDVAHKHVAFEILVLVAGGRTIVIEMASETGVVGETPPVFAQIAQSVRLP